jgi:hypothetical protein
MKWAPRRSTYPRPTQARISSMLLENDPFPGADAEPARSAAYPCVLSVGRASDARVVAAHGGYSVTNSGPLRRCEPAAPDTRRIPRPGARRARAVAEQSPPVNINTRFSISTVSFPYSTTSPARRGATVIRFP